MTGRLGEEPGGASLGLFLGFSGLMHFVLSFSAEVPGEIGSVAVSDDDAVMTANQSFYQAHEQRDIGGMVDAWEHSDRVACIHPGWPILRGWEDVAESWRRILAGPGDNQFILTNESVVIDGDHAWVTLDENLVSSEGAGTIAATNVFARQGNGAWLLVLHHGSPVMAS